MKFWCVLSPRCWELPNLWRDIRFPVSSSANTRGTLIFISGMYLAAAERRGEETTAYRSGSSPAARSRWGPALRDTRVLRLFRFIFTFYNFFHSSSSSSLIFFFYPFILSFYFSLLLPPFLILLVSLSKIIIIIIIIISHAHYSYAHALQCLNLHTLYKGGHKLSAILFIKFHLFLKLSPSLSKFPLKIACLHQFSVGCPCTNCPASNVFSF